MTWIPDYSHPIFGVGDSYPYLQEIMRWPVWARRRWLQESERFDSGLIYRYQDFNPENSLSTRKAEDLIVDSRLYLPSPTNFNDPYEFQARLVLSADPVERRKYFKKLLKNGPLKGKALESRLSELIHSSKDDLYAMERTLDSVREKWGVACFALDPRNLLMWSHYSAGHSGICLQFDLAEDAAFAAQTHPVIYAPKIATIAWPPKLEQHFADAIFLQKWEVWKEEKEVRYFSNKVVNRHLPLLPQFLKGIILGNRFPESLLPALDALLRRRALKNYPRLRLFRADRFRDRYGMFIRRLNTAELAHLPNAYGGKI